jgi:hypothetical protein
MAMRSLLLSSILLCCVAAGQTSDIPHLEKHGTATQLTVDGKPFLMLGAELHNSSSSSLEYMRPIWPRLAAIPLNTATSADKAAVRFRAFSAELALRHPRVEPF